MKTRRVLAILMVIAMVFSSMPLTVLAAAEDTSAVAGSALIDMPKEGFWSTEALKAAVSNGLLNGFAGKDGTYIRPDDPLTRAQMAAIVNRAFGAQEKAVISIAKDVPSNKWYHTDMQKAVKMGTMKLASSMRPNDSITRQEAFTILGRALKMEDGARQTLSKFSDSSQVADWAASAMGAMVKAGYIKGDNNLLTPTAIMTRAQFAVIMNNVIKQYIATPGAVTEIASGNVMINVPGVTLKDVTISGNLILGEGIGEGTVTLKSVLVKGNIIARGGGVESIIITGGSVSGKIVIAKIDGKIRIFAENGAEIKMIEIDDGKDDVIIEGNVGMVEVTAEDTPVIIQNANVKNLNVKTEGAGNVIVAASAKVANVVIDESARGTKIDVAGTLDNFETFAQDTKLSGTGTATKAKINTGANGSSITTPKTVITNGAATGVTGGGGKAILPNTVATNNNKGDDINAEQALGGGGGGQTFGVFVSAITVNKTTIYISPETTEVLEATVTVTPDTGANKAVTWISDNTDVATVNANGEITAVAKGIATITAKAVKDGSQTATCLVRVVGEEIVALDDLIVALEEAVAKDLTIEENFTAVDEPRSLVMQALYDLGEDADIDEIEEIIHRFGLAMLQVNIVSIESNVYEIPFVNQESQEAKNRWLEEEIKRQLEIFREKEVKVNWAEETSSYNAEIKIILSEDKPAIEATATLTVAANQDQAAPTGLATESVTESGNDGKITNTTAEMEYRIKGDGEFTAITGTEVTGLAAGTYEVRLAAKEGFNAGDAATLTVTVADTTVLAEIDTVVAENGKVTITLKAKPTEAPVEGDFTATSDINEAGAAELTLAEFNYDDNVTVTYTFAEVAKTEAEQSVVVAVTLGEVTKSAAAFTVAAADPTKALATTVAELEAALLNTDVEEITIDGVLGSEDRDTGYTIYNVNRAVTIKGVLNAKVFGTFIVKADDVTIKDLALQNKGDKKSGSTPKTNDRAGILVFADTITITNNTLTNSLGNTEGIANGIQLMRKSDTLNSAGDYVILGNSITGFGNNLNNWGSTGLLVVQGLKLTNLAEGAMSYPLTLEYGSILSENTFNNNELDLVHKDWKTGAANKGKIYPYPITGVNITGNAVAKKVETGKTLTVNVEPNGAIVSYQWVKQVSSQWIDIDGATSETYTPESSVIWKWINVRVTGVESYGGSVYNKDSILVLKPITAIADITGEAKVGKVLTAGTVTPTTTAVDYQWQISDSSDGTYTDISSATKKTYTPVADDVGKFIRVKVTGNGNYSGTLESNATHAVVAADTAAPVIAAVSNADVEVSDATNWTAPTTTATDNVDTIASEDIVVAYSSEDATGGSDVTDLASARTHLATVGNTVKVTYNVSDAAGNAAVEVSATFTAVADADITAPVVTGVTEGQVIDLKATPVGVTPASVDTDIATTVLTKDSVAVVDYALGTAIAEVGTYVLTVTDTSDNETVINFVIKDTQ